MEEVCERVEDVSFIPYQQLWTTVADLSEEVLSQEERVEKLEICCGRLIMFMMASIERVNALTRSNNTLVRHNTVLRKAVDHIDQMQTEITCLQSQLAQLKRAREMEFVHEAVLCDQPFWEHKKDEIKKTEI